MVKFEYTCPHCEEEMSGSFGDNVYCEHCDITFETDWDSIDDDTFGAWLTGKEYDGPVDSEFIDS